MNDRIDSKIRELTIRLMQSAPQAPPFPERTMSHLVPQPPRRRTRPGWVAVAGAAAVLVVVGLPFWLFGRNDAPVADGATTSTSVATATTVTVAPTTAATGPTTTTNEYAIDVPTSGDCVIDAANYLADPSAMNVYYGCFALGERFLVPRPRLSNPFLGASSAGVGGSGPRELSWQIGVTLGALLAGPNSAEVMAGYGSFFSNETAGMLRSVDAPAGEIPGPEHSAVRASPVIVSFGDFSQIIPNASTSAGSMALLDQLNATVFQFPEVASVEYRFGESCDAFYNWLQRDCVVVTRAEWEADPPQIAGLVDEAS